MNLPPRPGTWGHLGSCAIGGGVVCRPEPAAARASATRCHPVEWRSGTGCPTTTATLIMACWSSSSPRPGLTSAARAPPPPPPAPAPRFGVQVRARGAHRRAGCSRVGDTVYLRCAMLVVRCESTCDPAPRRRTGTVRRARQARPVRRAHVHAPAPSCHHRTAVLAQKRGARTWLCNTCDALRRLAVVGPMCLRRCTHHSLLLQPRVRRRACVRWPRCTARER